QVLRRPSGAEGSRGGFLVRGWYHPAMLRCPSGTRTTPDLPDALLSGAPSGSGFLVLTDRPLDLLRRGCAIIPGRIQVCLGQRGVGPEKASVRLAQASPFHQQPDRYAGAANAGVASGTPGRLPD